MTVRVTPDLALHVEVRGDGAPVLLLHGFSGSARSWEALAPSLSDRLRLIAVDLIGHGQSDAPERADRYRPEQAVRDLASLLDALGIARAHVVGYSLGGRLALRFAMDAPERIGALVVVSASAGLADEEARRERAAADGALADRIERDGIERFVAEWEGQELFAAERSLPPERRAAARAERLAQRPHGLANSLRGMGQGAAEPLWQRLAAIAAPALVVTGALDARYTAIGARLAAAIPAARHAVIAGAGHAVHRERPDELARAVREHLLGDAAARALTDTRMEVTR